MPLVMYPHESTENIITQQPHGVRRSSLVILRATNALYILYGAVWFDQKSREATICSPQSFIALLFQYNADFNLLNKN